MKVMVNYVGTAGLATLLVIIYYFMVHEPANDPFRVNGQTEELLSRPNPVDLVILCSLRGALKRIRFGTNKKTEVLFLKVNSLCILLFILMLLIINSQLLL